MNRPETSLSATSKPTFSAQPEMLANYRVLVVDDDAAVLSLYETILAPSAPPQIFLENPELFPTASTSIGNHHFELTVASQGQESLELAEESRQQGRPFAVAFVDVRMPPGMDGLETARRLRAIDPQLHIVIASAYSDYQPSAFRRAVHDRLFFMRKPFIPEEIEHMAYNACANWNRDQQLQQESNNNFLYRSWLQQLFAALPIPVTVIDTSSYEVLLNTGSVDTTDLGTTCYQQLHHQQHPCHQDHGECPLQTVLSSGKPTMVRHTHYDNDGAPRLFEVHGIPIVDESGEIQQMLEFAIDITDHEEEISHSLEQKETLLRQQRQLFNLFRSTAHTMKNSISYLGGIAERVAENQDHPEEIPELLNPERMGMVQGQISMIKTMVQLALENARKSAVQEERLPIREKIEEVVTLFSITSRGKGKPVELQLDDALQGCISTTPIDGQTLLLNLLNNAADAVDEYFSQLIEQGTSESFEQLTKLQQECMISIQATWQEGRAEITISNRGEPIASDVTTQIFEQGFSLKTDGNGVGLYDVQQILKRIGGTIELRNGEQQVSFVLSLPTLNCDAESKTA